MAVVVPILDGKNVTRDFGIQGMQSAILSEGIWRGHRNDCEVTAGQVETGVCFVKVTRDNVTPNEEFTVPVSITSQTAVDTATDGFIIVKLDDTKVNLGLTNSPNGDNIATIENVATLPSKNYLVLAEISGGTITLPAERFAKMNTGLLNENEYYGIDVSYNPDILEADIYAIDKLKDGAKYIIQVANDNSGACTLDINGFGAKPLLKLHDQDLILGDIEKGQMIEVVYSESEDTFQMLSIMAQQGLREIITKQQDLIVKAGEAIDTSTTPKACFIGRGDKDPYAGYVYQPVVDSSTDLDAAQITDITISGNNSYPEAMMVSFDITVSKTINVTYDVTVSDGSGVIYTKQYTGNLNDGDLNVVVPSGDWSVKLTSDGTLINLIHSGDDTVYTMKVSGSTVTSSPRDFYGRVHYRKASEQKDTSFDSVFVMDSSSKYIIQSYISEKSYKTKIVRFDVSEVGSPGDCTLDIYEADSNDEPAGASLSTTTSTYESSSSSIFFIPNIILNNSKKYVLVLKPDSGVSSLNHYVINYDSTGAYTNGKGKTTTDNGGTFTEIGDFTFNVLGAFEYMDGLLYLSDPETLASNYFDCFAISSGVSLDDITTRIDRDTVGFTGLQPNTTYRVSTKGDIEIGTEHPVVGVSRSDTDMIVRKQSTSHMVKYYIRNESGSEISMAGNWFIPNWAISVGCMWRTTTHDTDYIFCAINREYPVSPLGVSISSSSVTCGTLVRQKTDAYAYFTFID